MTIPPASERAVRNCDSCASSYEIEDYDSDIRITRCANYKSNWYNSMFERMGEPCKYHITPEELEEILNQQEQQP